MNVQQVKFRTADALDYWFGGIMVDDEYIICGCCGGVFDKEDMSDGTVCEIQLLGWVNISDEIKGDE